MQLYVVRHLGRSLVFNSLHFMKNARHCPFASLKTKSPTAVGTDIAIARWCLQGDRKCEVASVIEHFHGRASTIVF